jgi:hypothetical protein
MREGDDEVGKRESPVDRGEAGQGKKSMVEEDNETGRPT